MDHAVDYIIVGQGLAGSALAWELLMRGKTVVVYDEPLMNTASNVSAGIFNPITGKAMVRTYKADELFPFLADFYRQAETQLDKKFFFSLPVYRPFLSQEEMVQWKAKIKNGNLNEFVSKVYEESAFGDIIHDPYGGLRIAQAGYLNVPNWISAIRDLLTQNHCFFNERFMEEELIVGGDIRYGGHTASKIIFCNGLGSTTSKWFGWLPLHPLKGETIQVMMEMDSNQIFSRGVYIVPSGKQHTFVVGSTYQHLPFTLAYTEEGQRHLESRLKSLTRLPFTIIHQDWGIRPTVIDRRPLIGPHPSNKNVIIFNGLGTKGVSLAPYFAKCLADYMEMSIPLPEEVNIFRFKSLYSR